MSTDGDKLLEILTEIRNLLIPISVCFEDQYRQVQKRIKKLETLKAILTPIRRKIYPLLFDSRHLSQAEIAQEAGTTQPTVSRFINTLLEENLIEHSEEDGVAIYQDKYNLVELLQNTEEE